MRVRTHHESSDPVWSVVIMIWAGWLFLVLAMSLLEPLLPLEGDLAGEVAVLLHTLWSVLALLRFRPQIVAMILATSLAARTALVFWDLHMREVFVLTNSGADTEVYYYWAVQIGEDPSLLGADIRAGAFPKVVGVLFYLIGPSRTFAQYTNVLFGVSGVLLIYALLKDLRVPLRQATIVLALAALMPNAMVLSAIFLRESIMSLLTTVSVFCFTKWFRNGSIVFLLASGATVLIAAIFHSGVIAVGLGYMVVIVLFRRSKVRFAFGRQTIGYLAVFAVLIAGVISRYPDLFLGKFDGLDTASDIMEVANYRGGGSQYLGGLVVTSYGDLLLFGPIKAFYFLAAPLPWDFRSLNDVVAFLFDSVFYVGTLVMFWRYRRHLPKRDRLLGVSLFLVICVSSFVFGAGVSNSGTAIRHRYKLLALFLVLAGLAASGWVRRAKQVRNNAGLRERPLPIERSPSGLHQAAARGVTISGRLSRIVTCAPAPGDQPIHPEERVRRDRAASGRDQRWHYDGVNRISGERFSGHIT